MKMHQKENKICRISLVLICHVAITSCWVISLRISRSNKSGEKYSSQIVVLLAECLKFSTWNFVLFAQKGYSITDWFNTICNEILQKPKESAKMLLPSALYTVQNNLLFIALTNLDAATYQVTYEMKILTTAFFSVVMLKKQLEARHWTALIMLTIGICFVQAPQMREKADVDRDERRSNQVKGLISVLLAAVTSGFSGVFYEKTIKIGAQTSFVLRNLQLAFPSIFFSMLAVLSTSESGSEGKDYFRGFTPLVWLVVLLQAFGGLMVAVVVKYSDNIIKGFASAASIVVSSLCSYFVLQDLSLDSYFVFGAFLVISSILIYGGIFNNSNNAEDVEKRQSDACVEVALSEKQQAVHNEM